MNNKRFLKLFTLILLFTAVKVNAYELCTPTEEYKVYQKMSKEEKAKYIEPIFCSEIATKKKLETRSTNLFPKTYISVSDQSYNSYTDGKTTIPKNQYHTGLCWNFSAISTVESNSIVKGLGTFDLSEAHLAYSILGGTYSDTQTDKYNIGTDGGKITYAPSYFYGGFGQLSENEMSFTSKLNSNQDDLKKITSSTYTKGRNIVTLDNFYLDNYSSAGACSNSDISTIKTNIIKYGSVLATMYMDQYLFKDDPNNGDYYLSTRSDGDGINHGIVIVGWDDTIPASNFNGATRNGAWIIKNSWGSTWSNDGFFYISYDDEFICNLVANYEVSTQTKSYAHTYKSAPVLGIPIINMTNDIYLASKFTKESTDTDIKENIERVTIAIGESMNYTVYLSKDNSLKNTNNSWIEIASGRSDKYGMQSLDLSEIQQINNDYTIIVKYEIDSGVSSSLFTTCDYMEDTATLDYQSGKNYISSNGTSWSDLTNLTLGGTSVKCKPNTYVYTNEASNVKITNTTTNDNIITVDLKLISIDTNNLVYSITNSQNQDVTSNFTITPDYTNNKVTITSNGTQAGTFAFKVKYNEIEATTTFELTSNTNVEVIDDTKLRITEDDIFAITPNNQPFTYKALMDNLRKGNNTVTVENASGTIVTNDTDRIGTGSTITVNNKEYVLVLIGDASGEGKISSLDLLKIIQHLQHTITLNSAQVQAADITGEGKISSLDMLRLIQYLQGNYDITVRG